MTPKIGNNSSLENHIEREMGYFWAISKTALNGGVGDNLTLEKYDIFGQS